MDKMQIYDAVRECPKNALKQINAGRLKGKSDINPMWRIKALTEQFGACGVGWFYEITRQWTETGANGEQAAFCNINLYYKAGDEWSKPVQGTGGSAFIAREKNGMYTSDECYKMALTDAISVACKALGFAADVYWQQDSTKYSQQTQAQPQQPQQHPQAIGQAGAAIIYEMIAATGSNEKEICEYFRVRSIQDLTPQQAARCKAILHKKQQGQQP